MQLLKGDPSAVTPWQRSQSRKLTRNLRSLRRHGRIAEMCEKTVCVRPDLDLRLQKRTETKKILPQASRVEGESKTSKNEGEQVERGDGSRGGSAGLQERFGEVLFVTLGA